MGIRIHDDIGSVGGQMSEREKIMEEFIQYLIYEREVMDNTITVYKCIINRMFDHIGLPPYEGRDITRYMQTTRDYSRRYQSLIRGTIRNFYDFLGKKCPLVKRKRGRRNVGAVEHAEQPKFTANEILRMIDSTKYLDSRQTAFLALSTTYGFRRGEIGSLTDENIDWDDASFRILILKSREWRTHLIAPQITPILLNYGFHETMSPPSMSRIFQQIRRKAGMRDKKGYGWHAIRRRLAIELDLVKDITSREIHQFMNWKAPQVQGVGGDFISPMMMKYTEREALNLDMKVFDNHPFLDYWER